MSGNQCGSSDKQIPNINFRMLKMYAFSIKNVNVMIGTQFSRKFLPSYTYNSVSNNREFEM